MPKKKADACGRKRLRSEEKSLVEHGEGNIPVVFMEFLFIVKGGRRCLGKPGDIRDRIKGRSGEREEARNNCPRNQPELNGGVGCFEKGDRGRKM